MTNDFNSSNWSLCMDGTMGYPEGRLLAICMV